MQVVDLTDEHMRFVTHCTHDDTNKEKFEKVCEIRENWIRESMKQGLKVKVALDNGEPVGFAHCLPIELGTYGMRGKDVMAVPCLTLRYKNVYKQQLGSGYGRALMKAVEEEARKTKKGSS